MHDSKTPVAWQLYLSKDDDAHHVINQRDVLPVVPPVQKHRTMSHNHHLADLLSSVIHVEPTIGIGSEKANEEMNAISLNIDAAGPLEY